MQDMYTKRGIFIALMITSLALGIAFFASNNFNFIAKAAQEGVLHIPNIAYAITRIISCIILPLIFISPSMFEFGQIKLTRITFIVYGIFQLLTLTWVFYFLNAHNLEDLLSMGKMISFQKNPENAFVASRVFWDTYSPVGSLFTLLYSILTIYTGICFDDDRKKVRTCILLMFAVKLLLPLLYNIVNIIMQNGIPSVNWLVNNFIATENGIISTNWLVNNFLDLLSILAYSAAICFASTDDSTWVSLIWNQSLPEKDDEDEDEHSI